MRDGKGNSGAGWPNRRVLMKVLVAEDDRASRQRITTYLREWGYEAIEAADGAEAWEKYQQVDPGIIITDWLMPGMDGLEFIRNIRSDVADPTYHYIILLTARTEMKDVVEGLDAGADDFVSKPFDKDELRVRVQAGRRIISLEHALEQQNEQLAASNREIMRDITARKRAEDALQQTVKKLEQSNAELEQFAYVASHDLQEPLRAISGCVQILGRNHREKLNNQARELIDHTIQGTARMHELINDLLAFSRVAHRPGSVAPTSLDTVLAEARRNLESAIAESGAVITHDALPTVAADPTQCLQLLQNLLGNAIKFRGPTAPVIHISAKRLPAFWQVSVRDNGIGIEEQYFDRIFTLFQRLHTREEYPGTGFGLSICRKIVESHGGRIWVESRPGEATSFLFTLPVC